MNLIEIDRKRRKEMYLLGRTLRRIAAEQGKPYPVDTNNNRVVDSELYEVTGKGFKKVEL